MSNNADIFVQPETAGKIEVLVQEQCQFEINTSLLYVKSGQKEIQDYVENVSKPEIDSYIETEAEPIVSEVVKDISEPQINEYVEKTVKPVIDEYVLTEVKPLSDSAAENSSNASNAATAAAGSAATALTAAGNAESSKTAAAEAASSAAATVNGFDEHAAEKTIAFDENATQTTDSFNTHVAAQTTAFDEHVVAKTTVFDGNATEKTNDFNANAEVKQTAVDSSAAAAADSAQAAANSAEKAESWATGTIETRPEGSAEYWAGVAKGQTLPDQSGSAGKWLGTDGTVASWKEIDLSSVKQIGYEKERSANRDFATYGELRVLETDEIVSVNAAVLPEISGAYTLNFNITELDLSKGDFTLQVKISITAAGTYAIGGIDYWVNNIPPDFSETGVYLIAVRFSSGKTYGSVCGKLE